MTVHFCDCGGTDVQILWYSGQICRRVSGDSKDAKDMEEDSLMNCLWKGTCVALKYTLTSGICACRSLSGL